MSLVDEPPGNGSQRLEQKADEGTPRNSEQPDPYLSERQYFEAIPAPYLGTCQWIYEAPEYEAFTYQNKGTLIIRGQPGSGKSVLLKSMLLRGPENVDYMGASNDCLNLSYFFRHGEQSCKSMFDQVLRAILLQMVANQPEISRMENAGNSSSCTSFHQIQTEDLKDFLEQAITNFFHRCRIRIFLDSFENCPEGERNNILKCLHNLKYKFRQKSKSRIHRLHLIISFQNTIALNSLFDALSTTDFQLVSIESFNKRDIRKFVETGLVKATTETVPAGSNAYLQEHIRDRIIQNSNSCFLMASLFMETTFEGMRLGEDHAKLEERLIFPPAAVQDLWSKAFDALGVPEQTIALAMLFCVLVAFRPLSVKELNAALCNEPIQPTRSSIINQSFVSDTGGLLSIRQMESSTILTQPDAGLKFGSKPSPWRRVADIEEIEAGEMLIAFVNPLIPKFLEVRLKALGSEEEMLLLGHKNLAEHCIRYLQANRDKIILSRPNLFGAENHVDSLSIAHLRRESNIDNETHSTFPFLEYSARYLFSHCGSIDKNELGNGALNDILSPSSLPNNLHFLWGSIYGNGFERRESIIQIAAEFDMRNFVASKLQSWKEFGVDSRSSSSLLHWAASGGSFNVACYLRHQSLNHDYTQTKIAGQTTADYRQDMDETVWDSLNRTKSHQYLFRLTSQHRSVLHLAAAQGHTTLINLFLKWDQEYVDYEGTRLLELIDIDGNTALHFAAYFGHADVVKLLLDSGANYKIPNRAGQTAKFLARATVQAVQTQSKSPAVGKEYAVGGHDLALWALQAAEVAESGLAKPQVPPPRVDSKFMASIVEFRTNDLSQDERRGHTHFSTRQDGRKFASTQRFLSVDKLLGSADNFRPGKDSKPTLKWIHLPANNMRWVELLMLGMNKGQEQKSAASFRDGILKPNLWIERLQRGSRKSQISFMKSTCEKFYPYELLSQGGQNEGTAYQSPPDNSRADLESRKDSLVLFMPFIHWETHVRQAELGSLIFLDYLSDLLSLTHGGENLRKHSAEICGLAQSILGNFRNSQAPIAMLEPFNELMLESMAKEENWSSYPGSGIPPKFRAALSNLSNQISKECQDQDIELITADAKIDHPLHIRRTLDQSYYYMLDSTRLRDGDQVVTRYCEKELKREVPVVMMVDQLWLWIVDDTIITCFPKRQSSPKKTYDPDPYDSTDVLKNILQHLDQVEGPTHLLRLIINECTGISFNRSKNLPEDFQFLDIFANSINNIANEEAARYRSFIKILKTSEELADSDILKDTRLLRGISILRETELLREIKDIIDELNMIENIIQEQKEVLEMVLRLYEHPRGSHTGPLPGAEAMQRAKQYNTKIDNLRQQSLALNRSINDLIDLQQKHANLSEARSSRILADATGKQGKTILVFTIVTILFLPPSFMASFFALSINSFQKDEKGDLHLSYVLKYMLIFSFSIFFLFGTLAFNINEIASLFTKIKTKISGTQGSKFEDLKDGLGTKVLSSGRGESTSAESRSEWGVDREAVFTGKNPLRGRHATGSDVERGMLG